MTVEKNVFLHGTAKIAQKLGVKKLTAVCPVEHDFCYNEDEKTWVQHRQEAEQKALQDNSTLAILNTDIIYGKKPSHLLHYAAQKVAKGTAPLAFHSELAKFKPLHDGDLFIAVNHSMQSSLSGQFSVRGNSELSMKEMLTLIETASGKGENTTGKPFPYSPMLFVEEFLHGMTIDRNMECLLEHMDQHPEENLVPGEDFWSHIASQPQSDVRSFYAANKVDHESLELPSTGDYKMPHLN